MYCMCRVRLTEWMTFFPHCCLLTFPIESVYPQTNYYLLKERTMPFISLTPAPHTYCTQNTQNTQKRNLWNEVYKGLWNDLQYSWESRRPYICIPWKFLGRGCINRKLRQRQINYLLELVNMPQNIQSPSAKAEDCVDSLYLEKSLFSHQMATKLAWQIFSGCTIQ